MEASCWQSLTSLITNQERRAWLAVRWAQLVSQHQELSWESENTDAMLPVGSLHCSIWGHLHSLVPRRLSTPVPLKKQKIHIKPSIIQEFVKYSYHVCNNIRICKNKTVFSFQSFKFIIWSWMIASFQSKKN